MKKYIIICGLLFLNACGNEEIKNNVKNCINDIATKPSEALFDKCFYYENEFQRQLSINFENILPKLFDNYGGIKDIEVEILEKHTKSAKIQIITKFKNGFIKSEKRNMIKVDNDWKMSSEIIKD